jgi:DNA repair photolyase
MHTKEAKGILSARNGMNNYRGCSHGCIYCDSRSKCYSMGHLFEDIEIKGNAPELLEEALRRKRNKCMIATGSMSDPYNHLEEKIRSTRKCLELIERYGFGLAIQTKSDRILRDLDLLCKISENAKCVVQMTLTTYDEDLCRILEPYVSTTKQRVEVLKTMRDHKIPTIVWLDPILPYINDTEENIRGILEYCHAAEVYGIIYFGAGLTLREGNREYFYQKLDEHFPGLKEKYQRKYGDAYQVMSEKNTELSKIVYDFCAKWNIVCDVEQLFAYMHTLALQPKTSQIGLFE